MECEHELSELRKAVQIKKARKKNQYSPLIISKGHLVEYYCEKCGQMFAKFEGDEREATEEEEEEWYEAREKEYEKEF